MKHDGLYPTTISWAPQNFDATTPIIGSSDTGSLAISDPELTDAYWIGWANFDDLPAPLKITRFRVDDQAGGVVCENAMIAENVDICVLSVANPVNYDSSDKEAIAQVFKNDLWSQFSKSASSYNTSRVRFLNKFDVNTILMLQAFLQFAISIDDASECMAIAYLTPANIYAREFSHTFTSSDITRFDGSNVPSGLSFTITNDDIDGTIRSVESNGHTVKYVCCGFGINTEDRPITTAGTGGGYWAPAPVVRVHSDQGRAYLIGGQRYYQYLGAWQQAGYMLRRSNGALDYYGVSYMDGVENIMLGGFLGTISFSELIDFPPFGMIASDGNFCAVGLGASYAKLLMMHTWDDICDTLSLQMRYGSTNTYSTDGDKYYAKISPDNQFLFQLANGESDFSDLRPWQIVGSTVNADTNRYTPDDKPPYTPGGDDTPQNVGASIERPTTLGVGGTSGFITQYVLTAAEIATLGRTLWTSFINPDYWKNFLFSLALDTGSFDMSSLLDYFISLRVYPFSLINVPSYAATGSPSIYVGSGMVPLTITGSPTLHTINNFADYIDAGSCVVHSAYFHDDFRDFSNVEIMLYLPYCGTVQLNPGDVVGGTLHAQYAVDFATGGCVAYVDLTSAEGISYPIAVLPGSIGADVPLTATNAGQIAARFAGDVINFASTVSSNAAADLNARASAATGAITGGASGALSRSSSGIGTIATGGINAGLQHASQALDMATRPAIGIPTLSGGRGFSSFGAPQTAYIQIRRGIYKRPQTYDHTVGSPASASKTIGSLSGLVKGAVDTAGLSCTADEAAEVRTLIAAGIII